MTPHKARVYCAGPLFNAKEQEEMRELAEALEAAGYATFLPQRYGLELTKVVEVLVERGMAPRLASEVTAKAIFALDVFQVVEQCDAIVVNLNGRVPDEGAVSEAAIAWCSGKVTVGYKCDSRSVFLGQDNPLVTGLFDVSLRDSCEAVVDAVRLGLASSSAGTRKGSRNEQIARYLELGGRIWSAAGSEDRVARIAEILLSDVGSRGVVDTACAAASTP